MTVEVLASFALSIAGAALLLTIRHVARPTDDMLKVGEPRRDWSSASFGLDLIVAALVGAPVVLAARIGISSRVTDLAVTLAGEGEANAVVDTFFAVGSDSAAAYRVMFVTATCIFSMCAYIWFSRRWGYDVRVPKGCRHAPLRLSGLVGESALGVLTAMAAMIVTADITR